MERAEIHNYCRFLDKVRMKSAKADCIAGVSLGFFMFTIYITYAYAFLIGGIWVDQGFYNHTYGRPYTAGDCISVFFGILFGLFPLVAAYRHLDAIQEGKIAGWLAFDVIDRQPAINQDSQTGVEHQLTGQIRFDDVSFIYPSHREHQVLKNIECTFEVGKTTAIIGAPGSGKSTMAQLIERFYEPTSGEVYVDNKANNKVKLRMMRLQISYVSSDALIFNNWSLARNVAIGKPDATEEEIVQALTMANAMEFID